MKESEFQYFVIRGIRLIIFQECEARCNAPIRRYGIRMGTGNGAGIFGRYRVIPTPLQDFFNCCFNCKFCTEIMYNNSCVQQVSGADEISREITPPIVHPLGICWEYKRRIVSKGGSYEKDRSL